ncbi:carboxylesterase [Paraglaciecola sp. L3A3]|uniref:alpha/beta hydrolase n=1 Tax=Paraglaciecola sp. L3A3 TaxID=2686358 RepID=UPI00131D47FC|nr:alpha/beta fold hydrolase [Paraglaciecola sp. L3A3]
MKALRITFFVLVIFSNFVVAQSIEPQLDKFDKIYQQELGSTQGCQQPELNVFRVCSAVLRNDGNAPFIMHHNKVTPKVVVLFHGLSDSPFYLKSIAKGLYKQGYNVVVALLPGHGKKDANLDMQDYELANRWRQHVSDIMQMSKPLGQQVVIGGFSTGGALATEYALQNPDSLGALLLFSGALALTEEVEFLTKIWGIQWWLKFYDGNYISNGPNQFKYPRVARFAVVELMEVILSTRKLIEKKPFNLAIFAAHSTYDFTTPIKGIKNILAKNQGVSILYGIDKKFNVCHGNLVLDQAQYQEVNYNYGSNGNKLSCHEPAANPQHADMLKKLITFLANNE